MTPDKITIHCTDTPNGKRVNPDAIRKEHELRFGRVGYHSLIQPDGELISMLGLNELGAHVGRHNTGNIGVALAGRDKFTPHQFATLRVHLDAIRTLYQIPFWEIYLHYEWDTAQMQKKTCPNMRIANVLCWYLGEYSPPIQPYLFKDDLRWM